MNRLLHAYLTHLAALLLPKGQAAALWIVQMMAVNRSVNLLLLVALFILAYFSIISMAHLCRCISSSIGTCHVQAFAPLSKPQVDVNIPERFLYILGCIAAGCGVEAGSWRAFRHQSAAAASEAGSTEAATTAAPPAASEAAARPHEAAMAQLPSEVHLQSQKLTS